MTETTNDIRAMPLFASLPPEAQEAIASACVPFDSEPGHVLVSPGMVGAGLFLLTEGNVALSVHNHEVTLGPGDIVGELALLDERAVHSTRVKTTSDVRGYCIGRDEFEKLVEEHPVIAVPIMKVLARRLFDTVTR